MWVMQGEEGDGHRKLEISFGRNFDGSLILIFLKEVQNFHESVLKMDEDTSGRLLYPSFTVCKIPTIDLHNIPVCSLFWM